MLVSTLFAVSAPASVHAMSYNDPCQIDGYIFQGVCVSTDECKGALTGIGGGYQPGFCPGLPDNVKCCWKGNSNTGRCQWTWWNCAKPFVSGYCPGPAWFKWCPN